MLEKNIKIENNMKYFLSKMRMQHLCYYVDHLINIDKLLVHYFVFHILD